MTNRVSNSWHFRCAAVQAVSCKRHCTTCVKPRAHQPFDCWPWQGAPHCCSRSQQPFSLGRPLKAAQVLLCSPDVASTHLHDKLILKEHPQARTWACQCHFLTSGAHSLVHWENAFISDCVIAAFHTAHCSNAYDKSDTSPSAPALKICVGAPGWK